MRPEDIDILIKDILLALPSFGRYSQKGDNLLDVIIEEAKSSYKIEHAAESDILPLSRTRYYLNLAAYISTEKRAARPTNLLQLYCSTFVSRIVMLKLSPDALLNITENFANVLAALQENAPKMTTPPSNEELTRLRNASVDAFAVILSVSVMCPALWVQFNFFSVSWSSPPYQEISCPVCNAMAPRRPRI